MVVVPAESPVTSPVLLIVATLASDENHGKIGCGVPDPIRGVVDPSHKLEFPVMVGVAFTVMGTMMSVPVAHPITYGVTV